MSDINPSNQDALPTKNIISASYQRWRLLKDDIARYSVIAGGLGVIVAIVLIFFYLLYVVFPLFVSAETAPVANYKTPAIDAGKTLLLAMEEQNEVAVRFTENAKAVFFSASNGDIIKILPIANAENLQVTAFAQGNPASNIVAFGFSDGSAVIVKHHYKVTYLKDGSRKITPDLVYPLTEEKLILDSQGQPLTALAVKIGENESTIVANTADGRVVMSHFAKEESLFDDEAVLERTDVQLNIEESHVQFVLLDKEQRQLFLATTEGQVRYISISDKSNPVLKLEKNVASVTESITSMTFLNGDLSLLIGDSKGLVSQWGLVREVNNNFSLEKIRVFKVSDQAVVSINSEQRRKGFITIDEDSNVGIYHSTAERELIQQKMAENKSLAVALSPRANALLIETVDNDLAFWNIVNEHPEVSIKSIWQKIWYESYPKPDYIWQSSSASNDFEPKFSLTPLVFGTLKAAFYAMMVAVPLAIMGAIYTAYFMAPKMRRFVKPSIEIMEALPTVILGFLAGLWLAPFVEENLVAIFSIFMIVPMGVMIFAYSWYQLPNSIQNRLPDGWNAALLIPVIIFFAWFSFLLSTPIETLFFNGDMRSWFNTEWGIGYDQRNSLVVGMAMGFAVIPTIFSITEDAIFSVPKHLTMGSVALGATPWQTMMKVVLLTASPGIFSAVMIGLGRAVGETMIVLMATGNTPVMDLSIFQGMRTLSANIAVEMPESEVNGTHYRVLFLAALVLFMFTFVFNTLAEIIRQRLREKYSSL